MSQMFCRRPHTADAKVLSQASPHGISWAQISTRTCLSVSKGEVFPFHAKQVQRNGIGAALSTLDRGAKRGLGVDGKRQSPAAFLPVKRDVTQFYRKLYEHWTVLDGSRKSLPTGVQIQDPPALNKTNTSIYSWQYNSTNAPYSYVIFHSSTDTGRDSAVGIATRYGLDGPGIEF